MLRFLKLEASSVKFEVIFAARAAMLVKCLRACEVRLTLDESEMRPAARSGAQTGQEHWNRNSHRACVHSMIHTRTYRSQRSESGSIGRHVTTSANKETGAKRTIVMDHSCEPVKQTKKLVADTDVGCRTNCLAVCTLHVASRFVQWGWSRDV